MAAAVATPTVVFTSEDQKTLHVFGTVALGPLVTDTYTTGGMVMSFAGIDDIKSGYPPIRCFVFSNPPATSPNTTQFMYQFNTGTTMANGKLQIFQSAGSAAPNAEFGSGAAITAPFADVLMFSAIFAKL